MRPLPRIALAALLMLGACATRTPPVPACTGPLFPLNPGLWVPGPEDTR